MSVQTSLFDLDGPKRLKVAITVGDLVGEGFDTRKFIKNFEVAAECAGGIGRLKALILELAIRGRLFRAAGAALKTTDADSADESGHQLFPLPGGWTWARTGDVFEVVGGIQKTPRRAPRSHHFPYLRVENVQRGRLDLTRIERFELESAELERWRLMPGDLLVVEGNGSANEIGRCALWDGEVESCVHQNHIIRCRPLGRVSGPFALLFLNCPTGMAEMRELAITTSGLYSLSVGKIRGITLPVPPLAEQLRIVTKVDQLMVLCDELESLQTKKRETGKRLAKSSLEALTTAESPEEFAVASSRVFENFDVLVYRAEQVRELRMAIRDLAVSGRLTGSTKGTGDHGWNPDGPFQIPSSWHWSALGDLAQRTDYGTSHKAHEKPSGVPVLRMNNIQDGRLDLSSLKYVPATTERLDELSLVSGDLLFNRTNSYELVGKMAVFREGGTYTFASYLIRVRLDQNLACPEYINLYFGSTVCRRTQIEPFITFQTNQANFNGTKLKEIAVPTPSKQEQERVVAKVAQLMKVCDELEARLRQAEGRAAKLVEAAVLELVA